MRRSLEACRPERRLSVSPKLDPRLDDDVLLASSRTTAGSCAPPSPSALLLPELDSSALEVEATEFPMKSVDADTDDGGLEFLLEVGKMARRGERRGRGGGVREAERWEERDAERGGLSRVTVSGSSVRKERPDRSAGRDRPATGGRRGSARALGGAVRGGLECERSNLTLTYMTTALVLSPPTRSDHCRPPEASRLRWRVQDRLASHS